MASNGCLANGFKVFPVKYNCTSKAVQQFFFKVHSVRDPHPEKPNDRTLFVINIPPYVDEECLRRLFGQCGSIERVFFHKKPTSDGSSPDGGSKYFSATKPITGYKVAYLVFTEPKHVQNALNLDSTEPNILFDGENPPLVGIKKWCREYNESVPDPSAMQAEIDTFMKDYDKRTKEKVEKEKAMEGVADEEGWITVTKHGRKPAATRTEARTTKIAAKEKKKRAQKELMNFYTFQIRESKMEHITQLRKKFEDDKNRIALLKASRKFRPF